MGKKSVLCVFKGSNVPLFTPIQKCRSGEGEKPGLERETLRKSSPLNPLNTNLLESRGGV